MVNVKLMTEQVINSQDVSLSENPYYKKWRILQTVLEMVEQRGLSTTDTNWACNQSSMCNCSNPPTVQMFLDCQVDSFNVTAVNDNSKFFVHCLKPTQKKKIPSESVTDILQMLPVRKYTNLILVIPGDPSPNISKMLYEFSKCTKIRVELFRNIELMFNVTKHDYVPKHEKISFNERTQLLNRLKITPDKLMLISPLDPVCRFYGFSSGNIIKITRLSETSEKYVVYKLVKKVSLDCKSTV